MPTSVSLRLCATIFAVAVATSWQDGGGGVSGLQCWTCSNWDNRSTCLASRVRPGVTVETCDDPNLGDTRLTAMCLTEIVHECQALVYKSYEDVIGNGGMIAKRWARFECVYVDLTQEPFVTHKACYWERVRWGRDMLHRGSGIQVVGRSQVKRTCYCAEDKCNKVEAEGCTVCGPMCRQASRDQCVTPGVEEEEFREDCMCLKEADPPSRLWPDCGIDPNRFEPTGSGGKQYRHYGKIDGVRVKDRGSTLPTPRTLLVALMTSFGGRVVTHM